MKENKKLKNSDSIEENQELSEDNKIIENK